MARRKGKSFLEEWGACDVDPLTAAVTIATFALGYLLRFLGEWWSERRAAARTREARAYDFQRETLVQLQDAMADLARTGAEGHYLDLMSFRRTGKWGNDPQDELSSREFAARRRVRTLRERVFDDTLRGLIDEFNTKQSAAGLARSESDGEAAVMAMTDAFERANQRLGEVLRKLY